MTEPTSNELEIILQKGDFRLRVAPLGASLRGLWRQTGDVELPIITGYSGRENKKGGQGDVLIPFPGRIRDGAYVFDGRTYQIPRNDKDGPNAIHGFLRTLPWTIVSQSNTQITFAIDHSPEDSVFPASFRSTVTYSLTETGLECHFSITNTGQRPCPVAAGFHPYFTVSEDLIDDCILHVPMDSVLEFDDGLIPTGNVLSVADTPLDFRVPYPIGDVKFNTCYANPIANDDGKTRLRLSSSTSDRSLTVWMDAAFPFVVLYSGDPLPESIRRRSLAIEPMTCGSDAYNHPEWGLKSLASGETFSGSWGVIA